MDAYLSNFIVSVISSLIASFIFLILTFFFSNRFKDIVIMLFCKLIGLGIEKIYKQKKDASDDLEKDINNSTFVKIYTGRGNEFLKGTFNNILNSDIKTKMSILLPKTNIGENEYNWVNQRNDEIKVFDTSYENENLLYEQIESIYSYLLIHSNRSNINIKRYNFPHFGRIIITDSFAYFTPYKANAHGDKALTIKFSKCSDLYVWLERLFNQIWNSCN